jgi:hypothetical protein
MRTTSPARAVRKPALLLAAIVAIVGAIACSDVVTAPSSSAANQVGAPTTAANSGYALASGKSDSTKKK